MRSLHLVTASCVLALQISACGPRSQVVNSQPSASASLGLCMNRRVFAESFSKQCGRSLNVKRDFVQTDDLSQIFASSAYQHTDKDLCLSSSGLYQLIQGALDNHTSGSKVSESTRWFIDLCQKESNCQKSWEQYGAQALTEQQKVLILTRCDEETLLVCGQSREECCVAVGKNLLARKLAGTDSSLCTALRSALELTK